MKFILAENKFILPEFSKFILDERFILEEDILLEAQATLKQLLIDLNKLDTLLPMLLVELPRGTSLKITDDIETKGDKASVEKDIQGNCSEAQNLLATKKDFKALIDQIRAKAKLTEESFTEEEVKFLQPLCYRIASYGQSVKDRLHNFRRRKSNPAEHIEALQKQLPKFIEEVKTLYKYFEKEEMPEKTDDTTIQRVNLAVAFEELLKLSVKYEKAFNNTAWNYSAITKDADRIAAISQFADKVKASGTASIPTSKLLWEAYFSWVWEDKLTDSGVRNVLVQQLFALGFSEKTNIFIPFLRNIVIEKKLTITQGAYTALHNLRAKNILKASHLQVDATPSLAYCPAILKTDSGNTVYRLVEQSIKLLAAAGKELQYKSDGDKITKVSLTKENQQGLLSFFYTDTQNTDGIDNMADAVARALAARPELTDKANTNCYLNPECKLRDESRIKVLIADMEKSLGKNFDDEDSNESDKKAITGDEGAAAMWKRITASTLGTEKNAIAMFLSYLVLKHAPSEAVAEKCYTLINKGLYKKDSTKPTGIGMSEVLNKLELYNKLIKDIKINSGNIEKTLEILLNTKNIPEGLK